MNTRFETYFTRALYDAKIDELVDTYSKKGYIVQERPRSRDDGFDLVLFDPNNKKTVAFEIKMLPLDKNKTESIEYLRQSALEKGYEFRLVTIAKPTRYTIEIDWLADALIGYFSEETIQEVEELASHVQYESVEVYVDSLRVTEDTALAEVHGTIDVELQYGSGSDVDSDMGIVMPYSLDFDGKLELEMGSQSINHANIQVDLSGWSEESE